MIRTEDIPKTTFSTRYDLYQYLVISFKLDNAPAHFMYLMNSIFMVELDKFVVVFIDNILVYYQNMKEHKEYLRIVLQWLWDHPLYAKYNKCEFWLSEVPFLGHMISAEGIEVDPSRVWDVLEWKPPRSMHQVHIFFGLVDYYHWFIPNFSKISKHITQLLKKGGGGDMSRVHNVRRHSEQWRSCWQHNLYWPNPTSQSHSMCIVTHQAPG
jgi:hypothetical protein